MMIDPVISKVSSNGLDPSAKPGNTSPAKLGESKFDQVRSRLLNGQSSPVDLPPEVKQISPERHNVLKAELTKHLQTNGASSVQQFLGVHMKQAADGISALTNRVNALPKTPAFDPLRQRLASIDHQFQSTGKLVNSLGQSSNSADLLKVQMQMYQMTENVELMSKAVEQVTSGVKSVLQTQL